MLKSVAKINNQNDKSVDSSINNKNRDSESVVDESVDQDDYSLTSSKKKPSQFNSMSMPRQSPHNVLFDSLQSDEYFMSNK